jgi:D-apionolactonase
MTDEPRELTVGPLRVLYAAGELRYLSVGSREVVRRIYMPVRDVRWSTINASIANEHIEQRPDGFRIEYDGTHRRGEIDFVWHATVDAQAANGVAITFTMDGEARSTFRTCRTGFCVLHPIRECAGQPVEVEHVDGTVERSTFPRLISPHQPFKDIRAIAHDAGPGVRARVAFDGDTFEMEDQRNWTDTSFKTYCRPLALPFPYTIEKGQRVRQAVTVAVTGRLATAEPADPDPVIRVTGDVIGRLPALGVQVRADVTPPAIGRLRGLNLSHLRLDLRPSTDGHGEAWRTLCAAAAAWTALDVPLELGVHLSPDLDAAGPELERLTRDLLGQIRPSPRVARWIVHAVGRPAPSAELVALARRHADQLIERFPVGGGTVGNFTELNRNRPGPDAELLAYPICPQIHATDDLSLIENLAAQGNTVRTARSFAPDAHVAVGPVSLARRPDPFAGGKSGDGAGQPVGDPRQQSAFGAAWTIGSLKYLAEAGADSVTYYEAAGPFGVQDNQSMKFPLHGVLWRAGGFRGGDVLACTDEHPLRHVAIALRMNRDVRVLVANLLWREQRFSVRVPGPWRTSARGDPNDFHLPAYGVACIDFDIPGD